MDEKERDEEGGRNVEKGKREKLKLRREESTLLERRRAPLCFLSLSLPPPPPPPPLCLYLNAVAAVRLENLIRPKKRRLN